MPQIDFVEAFAEDKTATPPPPLQPPGGVPLPVGNESFAGRSRFRPMGWGYSEWANIIFAGVTIAGGLFCAFYFFNGTELARTAFAWPGELLYPRPIEPVTHPDIADGDATTATGLPGSPLERRSSKTDPGGDPFSRTRKLISLDRPLVSFGHGNGLSAGNPPPFLPLPVFGPPVPPSAPAVPGLPGGSVGGLPAPWTLLSRLTLLLPGGDALTHLLKTAVATVPGDLTVNMRHDVARVRTISRRIVRSVVVRPVALVTSARGNTSFRSGNVVQNVAGAAFHAQRGISGGLGNGPTARQRMNAGSSAVSMTASAGVLRGGVGGTVGALGGSLRGTARGALRGVGAAVGGVAGGLGGGGRH